MIKVEVAYAMPNEQKIISVNVNENTTIFEAVIQSKIVEAFPEIDVETAPMGIFSKSVKDVKNTLVREGDRIEIYRPLIADPKEIRARKAAEKAKQEKANQNS